MKCITATMIALALVCGAVAQEAEKAPEKINESCTVWKDVAAQGMMLRLMGQPRPAVKEGVNADLINSIMSDAYARPQVKGMEAQKRAIVDFANEWSLKCQKALVE